MTAAETGESGTRLIIAARLIECGWRFERSGAFLFWHPPFHHISAFNTLQASEAQRCFDAGEYAAYRAGVHECCRSKP